MRYAVISSAGVVENVIELEAGSNWSVPEGYTTVASDIANITDTYENGNFIKHEPPPPPYFTAMQKAVGK
jgi:hypothetical protein